MGQAKIYTVFGFQFNEKTRMYGWDVWYIAATSSHEAEGIFRNETCKINNWFEGRKVFISTDHEHISSSIMSGTRFDEINPDVMDHWVNAHTRSRFEDGDLVEPTFRRIK